MSYCIKGKHLFRLGDPRFGIPIVLPARVGLDANALDCLTTAALFDSRLFSNEMIWDDYRSFFDILCVSVGALSLCSSPLCDRKWENIHMRHDWQVITMPASCETNSQVQKGLRKSVVNTEYNKLFQYFCHWNPNCTTIYLYTHCSHDLHRIKKASFARYCIVFSLY